VLAAPLFKVNNDGTHPQCYFRDKVGFDYKVGYLSYESDLCAIIGREKLSWGPSIRSNLLLAEERSPLFDMVSLSYSSSLWKFSMFATRLDDIYGDSVEFVDDTLKSIGRMTRYLIGHRIEVSWKDLLSVGFSEVVLCPSLELYYLTPVFFYLPYEPNLRPEVDHNFIWSFDIRLFLHNLSLYSEFLVDDIQYSPDLWGEPNHLGLNLGAQFADPFNIKRTFFHLEYTMMTRWVFTHPRIWHRYQYRGYPIGNKLGPDFDELYGKLLYHVSRSLDIYISSSFVRKGEGRIDSKWPIGFPASEDERFPEDNFLSGTIEKRGGFNLGVNLFTSNLDVKVELGYIMIQDYTHFPTISLGVEFYR
jgi:hypothetical protein